MEVYERSSQLHRTSPSLVELDATINDVLVLLSSISWADHRGTVPRGGGTDGMTSLEQGASDGSRDICGCRPWRQGSPRFGCNDTAR